MSTRALVIAAAVVGVLGTAAGVTVSMLVTAKLIITVPFPSLIFVVTAVAIAAILIVAWIRRRVASAFDAGAAHATQTERAARLRFLARLDHELKNPVMAIRAASVTGNPVIDAQATRIAGLIEGLRKIAELETCPIEHEPVDVDALIADVVDDLDMIHGGQAVTVSLPSIPWRLPEITGDMDLLYLALHNVVGNALKFTGTVQRTDARPRVEIRGRDDGHWVVLDIADSGIGIPADDLPEIFDELSRGSNARGIPGSGLGLSMARTVIRRHGGEVSVKSAPGHGTIVEVRLPKG